MLEKKKYLRWTMVSNHCALIFNIIDTYEKFYHCGRLESESMYRLGLYKRKIREQENLKNMMNKFRD